MKKFLYSVYDKQSKLFSLPFSEVNDSVAIRGFRCAIRNDGTLLHEYPQDYDLYLVGSFDDEIGEFDNIYTRIYQGLVYLTPEEITKNEET